MGKISCTAKRLSLFGKASELLWYELEESGTCFMTPLWAHYVIGRYMIKLIIGEEYKF